ncbi:MAG: Trk system potassium transporter TrkA [Clostridia bacterium]|nr:Trk system potassium transporter TrkA [Clostridia bacterium]
MKVAIVGAGKLGVSVAEALIIGDCDLTIIDTNEQVLDRISQKMDIMAINGNGAQIEVLKDANIGSYDFLLTSTNSDEANIIIASFAKHLGCKCVIARVREPEYMNQLEFIRENMSIDYIVNPDLSITLEIYKYLVEKYTLSNGIFTTGNASLIEFKARKMSKLVGRKIKELSKDIPNMLIVALSRNGKVIIPHGETEIMESDGLYLIGEKNAILEINKHVHERGKYTNIQKVMIIGGGKTGYYLAKKLADFGASVKLIEQNKERCHYLSTHLPNVMVLQGDGTDQSLLEEENFGEMDAVVTATGFDEENLLLAMMAKKAGVEDVISKVSRSNYKALIESIGVDMSLNPLDITSSAILRYIQGSKKIISSTLIQGQAEIMEINAQRGMALIEKPLMDLNLPEGVIVAAIHRRNKLIIPQGQTTIQPGDRVTIFSLLSDVPELETLFKHKRGLHM